MDTALAVLALIGAYLVGLITPFFRARWEVRFALFKKEWEFLHDDYVRDVGYEFHDPNSKLEYARDRHASLTRYLDWEKDRFVALFKRRKRELPDIDLD